MIGVLGGTFDPVHFGHLRPALEVQQALGLDTVRLVPARVPPHRPPPVASETQRLAMLEAAVSNDPVFTIDTREFDREGPSYTLDTLVSLRAEFPAESLCLLIGMDAFSGFASWHRWREIPEYAHIIVMTRPGSQLPEQGELADFIALHRVREAPSLATRNNGLLLSVSVSALDISGTQIRQLIGDDRRADYLLPRKTLDYIRESGLYREAVSA